MSRFSKLAAVLAAVPVLAFAASVSADVPGQLQGGPDTYLVKNLTKKTAYAATASATACNDEVEYSVQLHNANSAKLSSIVVSATLPAGTTSKSALVATPASGSATGTSGSVTVTIGANQTLTYETGSTRLYDGSAKLIKTLPDGITTKNGVNVGDLLGTTTEFVNFTAKVTCAPTPPVTPTYSCDLHAVADNATRKVTVDRFTTAQTGGATFQNAVIDWGDKAKTNPLTTLVGQTHPYAADGTYKIVATANFSVDGVAKTATCAQTVTFSTPTPPVTPPVTPPATPAPTQQLPNTGAGDTIGMFAAVMAVSTLGYRLFLSRKLSRR